MLSIYLTALIKTFLYKVKFYYDFARYFIFPNKFPEKEGFAELFTKYKFLTKRDKVLHLLVGFALTIPVIFVTSKTGFLVALLLSSIGILYGIGKEVYDSFFPKAHSVEFADLTATWAGAAIMLLIKIVLF